MSPFIREYAPLVPFDPVQYTWIDFASGPLATEEDARRLRESIGHFPFSVNTPNQDWPLPFERMCLLLPVRTEGSLVTQGVLTTTLERVGDTLIFQLWTTASETRGSIIIRTTGSLQEDRRIHVAPEYVKRLKKTEAQCANQGAQSLMVALRRIVALATVGDSNAVVARASANAVTNAKRIRKGKRPFFEWTTVEIKPRSVVSEPLGGTHASPKPHMRRGHVRRLKSGKVVTIKSIIVNKHKMPEEGFVFHDYVA
jgi:hypothetical protein